MTKRRAFTLVELIIAVFIFSYIAASLSTIYSTANRHMFQNYRRNVVKTSVLLSMRSIQNTLGLATRIDLPAAGAQGNVLAFATNVDQLSGCYPVSAAAMNPVAPATPAPPAWHYFCRGPDPLIAGSWNLYYHTGTLGAANAAAPCGTAGAAVFNPGTDYPVPNCGANMGGQTVTLMMRHLDPPAALNGFMFSRRAADGIDAVGSVRVSLRSFWPAANRGFGSSQRDIDFTLDSVITSNRSK